jgi:hypothetical protein
MHGEDGDQGTWAFHNTEFVGLIFTGGVASAATPELFGPRNPGQTGVAAGTAETTPATIKQNNTSDFIRKGASETDRKPEFRFEQLPKN